MARQGSKEFINLTLTEFLMVIIFVLITLLFSTFKDDDSRRVDTRLTSREVLDMASNSTRFSDKLFHEDTSGESPKQQIRRFYEAMRHMLEPPKVQAVLEEEPLPEHWDTLESIKAEAAEQQRRIAQLETVLKDLGGKSVKDLSREKQRLEAAVKAALKEKGELLRQIDRFKKAQAAVDRELKAAQKKVKRAEQAQKAVAEMHKELDTSTPPQLVKKFKERQGRYKNLKERADKQGVGNPLCWTDDGEAEYLFSIAILESGMFRVKGIYPDRRAKELRTMGWSYARQERIMTWQQFKEWMDVFWNYGQRNDRCRFMVKVQDRTKTKRRWKDGLALVENYFYKLEIP